MHWTVQEAITTDLSCCSGWLRWAGWHDVGEPRRPPCPPCLPAMEAWFWKTRGSRLILGIVVFLLYCTVSYCAVRRCIVLLGLNQLTVIMRQGFGIPTGWVGRCQPRTRTGPETIKCRPSAIVIRERKGGLQLAVRCQLNQRDQRNPDGRHVIKAVARQSSAVRGRVPGCWVLLATTAVPLLHSDLG